MNRLALACVACLFSVGLVLAQQPVPQPKGPAPRFQVITSVDKAAGQLGFTRLHKTRVAIPVQSQILVNGVPMIVTTTQESEQSQLVSYAFALKRVTVYDATGKKLTEAQALEKALPGMVVLESADGQPVDPIFLRAIRPETLVIVGDGNPVMQPAPKGDPVPAKDAKDTPFKDKIEKD